MDTIKYFKFDLGINGRWPLRYRRDCMSDWLFLLICLTCSIISYGKHSYTNYWMLEWKGFESRRRKKKDIWFDMIW